MTKLKPVSAAIMLLLGQQLAQAAVITGDIKDSQSFLPGAKVSIAAENIETSTDYQGKFEIRDLAAGEYQLQISYIGYQPKNITVSVTADEFKQLSPVQLNLDENTMEEVVAVGHIQQGEMKALNIQKTANRIMNVISADGIGKLPDRNAAEAVQRIAGVSIERDQGEGRFVAVRGLPSQWSSSTINGDRLPTAEEETTSRATAFDFFPSDLIELVEVSKAVTPDMEGDAIGGSVNFVTATAPKEQTLSVNLGLGDSQQAEGSGYSANVLYGDRSDDGKFGFLVNATAWERDWATDNYEPRRDGLGIFRLELRDYTGTRKTYGANAAAEYLLDEGKVYARTMWGSLTDEETHYKHRMRFNKNRVGVQHIRDDLITELTSFELGGEHYFGFDTTLDWKLSTYTNEFRYGNVPNATDNAYFLVHFNQKNVNFEGLYGADRNPVAPGKGLAFNTLDGGSDPWNAISTHLPAGYKADPAKTQLSYVELYKVDVQEKDKIVAELNLEHTYNRDLELKFGAKYRDKERIAVFSDEFYNWNSEKFGAAPTLADLQASGDVTLIDQPGRGDFLNDLAIGSVYQSQFHQVADVNQLAIWYNNNKDKFVLDEGESALVSNGGALGRTFDVFEKHLSFYGMGTYQLSDKTTVIGGLRLTQTKTEVSGQVYNADTKTLSPNKGEKDYWSVLPALHVKYSPDDLTNIRVALTRTFARPDFGALNPSGTFMEVDSQFTSGNPDLNPTYSNNLDIMAERFYEGIGVMSAGLFYKDIKDPIFSDKKVGSFNGQSGVDFITFANGENARLYGAELNFNRQFDFLTGIWSNFGINANLTWMDSEMTIPGRSEKVAIPRQADSLYNFALYYDDGTFSSRLALNHKGSYIQEHGSNANLDEYYGDYTSLDMTATYYINDNAMIYLELNNLTDEPLLYYLGNEQRPLQVEYYGIRGQIGFKYDFF